MLTVKTIKHFEYANDETNTVKIPTVKTCKWRNNLNIFEHENDETRNKTIINKGHSSTGIPHVLQ